MTAGSVDLGSLRRTEEAFHDDGSPGAAGADHTNTTIGVIATNARLDKNACLVVAQGGHDGMARALFPPHTSADGDALIVAATQQVDADLDLVRALAVVVVERAIRSLGGDAARR
jgi:L-aminopeptidase/D-esterase-like protein